jgi:hypothetical protein
MSQPDAKATDSKPEAKAGDLNPDVKTPEPTTSSKSTDPKPDTKAAVPQSDNKSTDLTSQIAKRAFELYESGGRQKDHAAQDWEQANREIQKDGSKSDNKLSEPKSEVKPKSPTDLTPKLVKKVHELYEQLGREEVRVVEELEAAQKAGQKDEK